MILVINGYSYASVGDKPFVPLNPLSAPMGQATDTYPPNQFYASGYDTTLGSDGQPYRLKTPGELRILIVLHNSLGNYLQDMTGEITNLRIYQLYYAKFATEIESIMQNTIKIKFTFLWNVPGITDWNYTSTSLFQNPRVNLKTFMSFIREKFPSYNAGFDQIQLLGWDPFFDNTFGVTEFLPGKYSIATAKQGVFTPSITPAGLLGKNLQAKESYADTIDRTPKCKTFMSYAKTFSMLKSCDRFSNQNRWEITKPLLKLNLASAYQIDKWQFQSEFPVASLRFLYFKKVESQSLASVISNNLTHYLIEYDGKSKDHINAMIQPVDGKIKFDLTDFNEKGLEPNKRLKIYAKFNTFNEKLKILDIITPVSPEMIQRAHILPKNGGKIYDAAGKLKEFNFDPIPEDVFDNIIAYQVGYAPLGKPLVIKTLPKPKLATNNKIKIDLTLYNNCNLLEPRHFLRVWAVTKQEQAVEISSGTIPF